MNINLIQSYISWRSSVLSASILLFHSFVASVFLFCLLFTLLSFTLSFVLLLHWHSSWSSWCQIQRTVFSDSPLVLSRNFLILICMSLSFSLRPAYSFLVFLYRCPFFYLLLRLGFTKNYPLVFCSFHFLSLSSLLHLNFSNFNNILMISRSLYLSYSSIHSSNYTHSFPLNVFAQLSNRLLNPECPKSILSSF